MPDPIRIPARTDEYALAGDLFLPQGEPKAALLVAGAMGVRAKFYAQFASYVAEQGAAALTLDYRGIGRSGPQASLRGFSAAFHEWGERDLGGAVDFLARRFPGLPLLWVGHSAGSQLMGLIEEPRIRAALFVASGTAYWRNYHGRTRLFLTALFFALIPAIVPLTGYLPSRLMGGGDDVPAGVALEWARWARDPRYVYAHAEPRGGMGFKTYSGPLLAISIGDDAYAPPQVAAHLLSLYTAARKEQRTIAATADAIGHFGFFRRRDLWPDPVRWLLSRAGCA